MAGGFSGNIMRLTQKTIIIFLIGIWIIFSFVYIVSDFWKHFKNEQLAQAYQQGKTDTVNQAIDQAENKKCEPFSVYNKDKQKEVWLVNVECVQSATKKESGQSENK
jgi:hypothetical protein